MVGPLHGQDNIIHSSLFSVSDHDQNTGLPISLKDQLCVKGLDATMGKLLVLRSSTINFVLK